jgi:alpha-L-rhamnosidase
MSAAGVVAVAAAVLLSPPAAAAQSAARDVVTVVGLETNAEEVPLGIDDRRPGLEWRLESRERGVRQTRYRVVVSTSMRDAARGFGDVWDSGVVVSDERFAEYAGPALASRTRYFWSVRVWTTGGSGARWSEPSWFETAYLDPGGWRGAWIAGPERRIVRLTPEEGQADDEQIRAAGEFCRPPRFPTNNIPNNEGECRQIRPAPLLRTSFEVAKPVARARIYTSGLAYNDLTLNGTRTSSAVLDPGFTDYSRTVLYTTHDVTRLLRRGENVLASELGSGQYDNSTRTWDWGWDIAEWRATPRLRLDLWITYADGSEQLVTSDDSWRVSTEGPRRYDSYYLGETYDARREIPGWNRPGFDASGWAAARTVEAPAGVLRAQRHEPIRVVGVRPPGTRSEPSPGVFVYDVGQNLTGWARIRVNAPAGTAIEAYYGEQLNAAGRVTDRNAIAPTFALVGGQLQTDYYIAKGTGDELWEPRFTYKGFQYVQISAPNGEPLPEGVSVSVDQVDEVRTHLRRTSSFVAGNDLLNRIHRNTLWAVQNNIHGIVTDTPQLEKNAWTGDAQLTAGTAALLFDTERLTQKQFQDMVDAQTEQGEVPLLAPSNENYGYAGKPAFKPLPCCGSTPAWDAFWFVIPWEAYQRYGDRRGLEQVYPAMQLYLDNWIPQWTDKDGDEFAYTLTSGLGDWDPPTIPTATPTNIALSSTAYYAHFADIAADVARVLGRPADAARYEELFENIRADFNAKFLREDGVYRNVPTDPFTHTAQVLPLAFGLAPEHLRDELAARLADDIVGNRGGNAYVGILGARYILPVLTEAGYHDVAYTVATQMDYPSWGYWIDVLGWTSLGEYWEETSRSRNHHFFGSIVQWFYEDLAGIQPLEPGYRTIEFRPEIPAGLNRTAASYDSVRGTIATRWHTTSSGLRLRVTVPANATGVVYVPASRRRDVTVTAGRRGGATRSVRLIGVEGDRVVYEVRSGRYLFQVAARRP